MIGPPGAGKTMLAQRLSTILPNLTFAESLETSKVYSVMGLMPKGKGLLTTRPFRAPHHTISDAGLIGGGQTPKPGEVSLSHNGVLFLDEMPEFKKNVLEVLRQPMENGLVTRISGPLMDRIDIHIDVPSVPFRDLTGTSQGQSSFDISRRVIKARSIQENRFHKSKIHTNAMMNSRHIRKFCQIDEKSNLLLEMAMEKFGLSARALSRILKISRTIADLAGSQNIEQIHIAEAIQYRSLDRKLVV